RSGACSAVSVSRRDQPDVSSRPMARDGSVSPADPIVEVRRLYPPTRQGLLGMVPPRSTPSTVKNRSPVVLPAAGRELDARTFAKPDSDRAIFRPTQLSAAHLWLSPSDLSAHLACPYLTRLELEAARKERSRPHGRDKLADLVAKKGDVHEAAFLADLQAADREVVEIPFDDGG